MNARSFVLVSALAGASSILGVGACVGDDPAAAGPSSNANAAPGADAAPGSDAAAPDAATEDAAPDAAAWTPAVLDGERKLGLWLEGSADQLVISNGQVGTWKDRSKNHNDATNSQAGPSAQAAAVNGHDAVRFQTYGVALTMADNPSLQLGADQFYLVAVAKSQLGTGTFFSKVSTTASGGGILYATGLELFVEKAAQDGGTVLFPSAHINSLDNNSLAWGDSVFDDGKFHLIALRRPNSFALAMTVDDQAVRTATTGGFDLSEVGKDARIGSVKYGNITLAVDLWIAEVLLIHDAKTAVVADADVANARAYLKQKYGL